MNINKAVRTVVVFAALGAVVYYATRVYGNVADRV